MHTRSHHVSQTIGKNVVVFSKSRLILTHTPFLFRRSFSFSLNIITAIVAWAKSRKFGKARRARAILDKMKSYYASGLIKSRPNDYCYTAVINACAYTERDEIEQRDALQVFVSTYKEMLDVEDVVPNNVTYFTALSALRHLLPADQRRADAVGTIFNKCIELGMFGPSVARRLQTVLDTEQLKGLVGEDKVDDSGAVNYKLVPAEWSRNVLRDR